MRKLISLALVGCFMGLCYAGMDWQTFVDPNNPTFIGTVTCEDLAVNDDATVGDDLTVTDTIIAPKGIIPNLWTNTFITTATATIGTNLTTTKHTISNTLQVNSTMNVVGAMGLQGIFNSTNKMIAAYAWSAASVDEDSGFVFTSTGMATGNSGKVSSVRGVYNWYGGDNATFTGEGVEGVVRSRAVDTNMTGRGVSGRIYAGTGYTMHTGIGVEGAYRIEDDNHPTYGSSYAGLRAWCYPGWQTNASTNVVNNYGVWIENEHATNEVAQGLHFGISYGGKFTKDIGLQQGATIDNYRLANIDISTNTHIQGMLDVLGTQTNVSSITFPASQATGIATHNADINIIKAAADMANLYIYNSLNNTYGAGIRLQGSAEDIYMRKYSATAAAGHPASSFQIENEAGNPNLTILSNDNWWIVPGADRVNTTSATPTEWTMPNNIDVIKNGKFGTLTNGGTWYMAGAGTSEGDITISEATPSLYLTDAGADVDFIIGADASVLTTYVGGVGKTTLTSALFSVLNNAAVTSHLSANTFTYSTGAVTNINITDTALVAGVRISSSSLITHAKYCVERPTNTATNVLLFSPDKQMTIVKMNVIITTNTAGTPTVDLKLQKAARTGFAPSDISFNVHSITSGVFYTSDTFKAATNSIGTTDALNLAISNPVGFENEGDYLLVDVWLKEQ